MEEPSRESSGAIARVDAKATMDKLEAAEPAPTNFKIAYFFGAPYLAKKIEKPVASAGLRSDAEKLGMTRLGTFTFASLFFGRKPREAWIDAARTTFVSMREGDPKGSIDKQMSPYNFETLFDDGTMIVTWGTATPAFEATDRALDRKGTGNLAADYTSHVNAVAEYAARGHAALAIADLQTALRIETWYDSRLRTVAADMRVRIMVVLLVTLVAILYNFWLRHL